MPGVICMVFCRFVAWFLRKTYDFPWAFATFWCFGFHFAWFLPRFAICFDLKLVNFLAVFACICYI